MQLQRQSVYQIRLDHIALLQAIEEADGLLDTETEQALSLTQEEFQDKAISYGFILKTFDDSMAIIEAEIERLHGLKDKAEKRKELFKQRLSEAMRQFGVEKIETPLLKLSFRKSESVEITDEKLVPADYCETKTITTISKTKIKEDIKAGGTVPGAQLITKQNLQVK